jgi:hypothetical protein
MADGLQQGGGGGKTEMKGWAGKQKALLITDGKNC